MTFRNDKYSNQTIEYYNKGVDSKKKKEENPKSITDVTYSG